LINVKDVSGIHGSNSKLSLYNFIRAAEMDHDEEGYDNVVTAPDSGGAIMDLQMSMAILMS
jgi:hypothetical protein